MGPGRSEQVHKKKRYKWCIVPQCFSTTYFTPEKLFVNVPNDEKRRTTWIQASGCDDRHKPISLTSQQYVCQDHFNMEEDMHNFLQFKLMGGNLRSKKHVVPHKFECQSSDKRTIMQRGAAMKPNAKLPIESNNKSSSRETGPSRAIDESLNSSIDENYEREDEGHHPTAAERSEESLENACRKKGSDLKSSKASSPPPKRSKLAKDDVFVGARSPSESRVRADGDDNEVESDDDEVESDDECRNDGEEAFNWSIISKNVNFQSLEQTRQHSFKHPMKFLGLPQDSLHVLDELANCLDFRGGCIKRKDVVMIVLRRIRMMESFDILGGAFGISKSTAERFFNHFMGKIADCLKELIMWPSKETIDGLLPAAFRAKYSNVQSIIYCYEIEMEKPRKAVNRALAWSADMKCYTLKYLVSCTPDGIVNFVSEGFGGAVPTASLLESTDYLDKLSPGMGVMADAGLNRAEGVIRGKGCRLFLLPGVPPGSQAGAEYSEETKKTASLRAHVKGMFQRFSAFKMLTPVACIDSHMIGNVDRCLQIAAGLINLGCSIADRSS